MAEFKGFPKLHRLFRTITVTEKLDGTNACIVIEECDGYDGQECLAVAGLDTTVDAQSRKRLLSLDSDNYGFARWVHDNADELAENLGPGRHYGEWWGNGIQRNYGLDEKRFSLFNPDTEYTTTLLHTVPVLYTGEFSQNEIEQCLLELKERGSQAVPGFMEPEGIVVYHHHGRHSYKVTLDDQDKHKWEVE